MTDRENEPQYHVKEDEGYITLYIRLVSLPNLFQDIRYFTTDATACKSTCMHAVYYKLMALYFVFAVDRKDYRSTAGDTVFSRVGQGINVRIPIIDNIRHDGDRYFLLRITSKSGINIWIRIFILDDEWGRCPIAILRL